MNEPDEKSAPTHSRRSEFVLATTISELILLLFFLLLLLFGWHYVASERREQQLKDEVIAAAKEKEKFEAALRAIYAKAGKEPSDTDVTVLVAIDKLQAMLSDAEKKLNVAEAKVVAMQQILKKLREEGGIFTKRTPEDFGKFADMAFCEGQASEAALKDKLLDDANRRNGELQARLKRCGGKGDGDYVACWRGSDNKIQYMFETTITTGGVMVARRWPPERDQEMSRFPNEKSLVGRTVSVDEFVDATTSTFQDSEAKHCRYYVVITGKRSEMSPRMFTIYHRIQDHFYHLPNIK